MIGGGGGEGVITWSWGGDCCMGSWGEDSHQAR